MQNILWMEFKKERNHPRNNRELTTDVKEIELVSGKFHSLLTTPLRSQSLLY